MEPLQQILICFETHDVNGIQTCFENGVDPNAELNDQPLIYSLIDMYTRGPGFKDCIKVFMDHGLNFDDKILLAVLMDDAMMLDQLLTSNHEAIYNQYRLHCTFTPLFEASLLHICAEYNHLQCAAMLVKHGMDVNIKAGIDANGFGGHTPIFHTVNQDANKSIDVLKFLLSQHADLSITVKGLIWGKDYEWETFIPDVNPVSYAMMGLLRQFQRTEADIYKIVSLLMKAKYGIEYSPVNIPNRYLNS